MTLEHAAEIPSQPVKAGKNTNIQVLVQGPNFAMRRFTIAPGGGMPEHTNTVEHEQYVLQGRARIMVAGQLFDVQAGDVVFIPEGAPHWYKNFGEEEFVFLCIIPNKPDEIKILASEC